MCPKSVRNEHGTSRTLAPEIPGAWAQALLSGFPDAVIVTDGEGRVRGWNRLAMDLYGYDPTTTVGAEIASVTPFAGETGLAQMLRDRLSEHADSGLGEFVYDDQGRGVAALRLSGQSDGEAGGEATEADGFVVVIHEPLHPEEDEAMALRGRVERKRALLETMLNHMAIGLMIVEAPGGNVFMLNREAERYISDFPMPDVQHAVVNATGAERLDGTPYAPGETPVARALKGEFVRQEELVRRRADGTPVPFSVNASPVIDSLGHVVYAIATFEDISGRLARDQVLRDKEDELSQLNERLLHDALHDMLTGLPNRALLLDRLEQVLQRRLADPSRDAALLFLDFDRFKVVNDSLGHSVGDAMLITIAKTLSKILRPEDTVARLGGDEFVILMDHLDMPERAMHLAERIRRTFLEPLQVEERSIFTSASIGLVPSLVGYEDPDDVLRDADTAMYAAKEAGRARYRVFDQRMRHEVMTALELENDLWRALANDEFTARYGPIHRLSDGKVIGFDALVRWQHPTRGLLAPKAFLNTATEMGIGRDIDQLVWRQACSAMNEWRERFGASLLLGLHFNPRHFLSPQPELALLDTLEELNTATKHTAIALGEGTLTEASEVAEAALLKIVENGIGLHLDNFGSGHHSLHNLQRFNVGTIKVDENVISRLPDDPKSVELVRAMTAMAASLKMAVSAKGVSTAAQHDILLELGCTYAQGPLFSEPLDEAGVLELLERQQ